MQHSITRRTGAACQKTILARVKEDLRRIGDLKGEPHTKACCALVAHPSLGRYVKTDKKGQLRLDPAKAKAEEKLDGKYLLSTSDEDAALGYKQLHRRRMPVA
jgi:hypothetical protein